MTSRRIAVCGKGGVGKTAFTAMLAGCLSQKEAFGRMIVVDADPAVGLPTALGVTCHRTIAQIRDKIVEEAAHREWGSKNELVSNLDYMVMEALEETDSFAFLAMGRSEGKGCFCTVNELLHMALDVLTKQFDTMLIDGEAGLEQISRQVSNQLDYLLILTDASWRGRETVEHIRRMAMEENLVDCAHIGVVLNHIPSSVDKKQLMENMSGTGLPIYGIIPEDAAVLAYDLEGKALTGLPKDSPALEEVKKIADVLSCSCVSQI